MTDNTIRLHYDIPSEDLICAGEASSNMKKMLTQLGINPSIIKRAAIAMYEAEINAVIHASGGVADIEISRDTVVITITDKGPGIADIELAMQEGYSTAPDAIREMGFGAGLGLPNIKRNADGFTIESQVGKGTKVVITVNLKS